MLDFNDVSFSYGEKNILRGFCFSAKENTATAVFGSSGCGKTTLFHLASGLLKPDFGTVAPFSGSASFVFQEDRLLPWSTALGNLTDFGIAKNRAGEYIEKVGLSDFADKFPDELSGGMKRRLSIARALAFGGDVFFFDEPLQGLDVRTAGEMLSLLRAELAGKTALVITHDPAEALSLCSRVVAVGNSPLEILADAPASDFGSAEKLREFLHETI